MATLYFGFAEMQHEPQRKVLYINMEEEEVSKALNMPIEEVERLVDSIKAKMLEYREKSSEMPYIDKTIYTNWNALMITGLCDYWKVFGDESARLMAERTAERLIKEYYRDGRLYHKEGVEGFSEDYVFFSQALLSLFEITQKKEYLDLASELMKKAIDLFWDDQDWGFYDSALEGEGLLRVRLKNLQDTPTQSVNGSAGYTLLLLGTLTGDGSLIDYAEKTLQAFSRYVREVPMASHTYLISLYAVLSAISLADSSPKTFQ